MDRIFTTGVIALSFIIGVQTHAEDSKFSTVLWKEQSKMIEESPGNVATGVIRRFDEMGKFFRDYDLIGMSRRQVVSLLGKPERLGYTISAVSDSVSTLQIEYENEKVKQFRMISFKGRGPWHQENMTWTNGQFTPKDKTNAVTQ